MQISFGSSSALPLTWETANCFRYSLSSFLFASFPTNLLVSSECRWARLRANPCSASCSPVTQALLRSPLQREFSWRSQPRPGTSSTPATGLEIPDLSRLPSRRETPRTRESLHFFAIFWTLLSRFLVRRLGHAYEVYPLFVLTGAWFCLFCAATYWSFGKAEVWLDRSHTKAPWDWERLRDKYWKMPTVA